MNPEIQNKLKNISLATGYIAEHVFDNLSFKNSLKTISVEIMSVSKNIKDISDDRSADKIFIDIKSKLVNCLDLMDLGRIDDSVSEMNARIYTQGLKIFMDNLSIENILYQNVDKTDIEQDKKISDRLTDILGGDTNFVDLVEVRDLRAVAKSKLELKPSLKQALDFDIYLEKTKDDSAALDIESQNEDETLKKLEPEMDTSDIASSNYVFNTKEESESVQRRGAILSVLALGGNSVNDIKRKFPKYSPKTLQRDINELIEEKKIVRIGEKRWAKYYLK